MDQTTASGSSTVAVPALKDPESPLRLLYRPCGTRVRGARSAMALQEGSPMTTVHSLHLELQPGLIYERGCGTSLSNLELHAEDASLSQ